MYVCFLHLPPGRTEVLLDDAFLDQNFTRECRIHPSLSDRIDLTQNCPTRKAGRVGWQATPIHL